VFLREARRPYGEGEYNFGLFSMLRKPSNYCKDGGFRTEVVIEEGMFKSFLQSFYGFFGVEPDRMSSTAFVLRATYFPPFIPC